MLVAAAREVAEETTLDDRHLQFYPRCFMTTDAIYNDDAGAVKYHFVISQVCVIEGRKEGMNGWRCACPCALLSCLCLPATGVGASLLMPSRSSPSIVYRNRWCAGRPRRRSRWRRTTPRTSAG